MGLAIGAAIVTGIGAASSPAGGVVGRYQIVGAGNHGMVLDTVTGQVWTTFLNPNGGRSDPDFFQPKAEVQK